MERKSIERFRNVLRSRRQELLLGLGRVKEEMSTSQQDYGKDEGDRANMSVTREIHLGQQSRERALLSAVEAALKRISEDTFGRCLNCEQEINIKRLQAIPWVRYCITCQELIDDGN